MKLAWTSYVQNVLNVFSLYEF